MLLLQVDNRIAENSREFLEVDPWGVGMTAIGMAVVFSSLLLLYIMFMNITKVLNLKLKKPEGKEAEKTAGVSARKEEISGEVNAAIAYALHMYFKEKHDYEDAVLTINRVSRTYSPWSSKLYGLTQNPRHYRN